MSKREEKRTERALRDVEFCEGCGCACDGKHRSDATREQARLTASPMQLRVA